MGRPLTPVALPGLSGQEQLCLTLRGPMSPEHEAIPSALRELRVVLSQARHVWRLVPHRHKSALILATVLLGLVSACYTAFPVLLGRLVDSVSSGAAEGQTPDTMLRSAG